MEILVRELGAVEELNLIDPETKIDWSSDFVVDDAIIFSSHSGVRLCSLETFLYWQNAVEKRQEISDRLHALKGSFSNHEIWDAIYSLPETDLEDWLLNALEAVEDLELREKVKKAEEAEQEARSQNQ